MNFYTYLHCRPDGTPFYVGKGCDHSRGRKRSHLFAQRSVYHRNIVNKYGRENILIYVFPCDSEEQAFADEIQQVSQLRQDGYSLCNLTDGGEGVSGAKLIFTQDHKDKISNSQRGKIISDATKRKMSLAGKGRAPWNKGIPWSKEHIEKHLIGNTNALGCKRSEETKAKIGASNSARLKGKPWTAARRAAQERK